MIKKSLPFKAYTQMDGVNNSKLSLLRQCPQKYIHFLDHNREDTPALSLGRAIHTAVLEPENFNKEFFCLPDLDRRTIKGREEYNKLCAKNADKTVLKADEFNKALEIATAVRSNSSVIKLLEGCEAEVSLDWVDHDTAIKCKARVDAYNEQLATIVDLKTTTDASSKGFPRKLFAYGYHRQAAFYLNGLRSNGLQARHFVFVAVEKDPPFAVGIYRLTDDVIALADKENTHLLRKLKACQESGEWPSYTAGIEDISIPTYAIDELEGAYGQSI
jgi:hypothetical protein